MGSTTKRVISQPLQLMIGNTKNISQFGIQKSNGHDMLFSGQAQILP